MVLQENYRIGSFCFSLSRPDELQLPANFLLFKDEGAEVVYTYNLYVTDELPVVSGELCHQRPDLQIYQNGNLEERVIGITGEAHPYAVYKEIQDSQAAIYIDRRYFAWMTIDTVFTSLFALEKRMLACRELVLHCAYVEYEGKAILFSGPSGIGKSTQASLWEQYRGARVINGDKALLAKAADNVRSGPCDGNSGNNSEGISGCISDCIESWFANGWPVCGSSEICHRGSYPIQAIVMLRQGTENAVRRLNLREAFMLVYAQVTVNGWNRELVETASDLVLELLQEVPVYELTCTISEEAVEVLESHMGEMAL